MIYKHKFVKNIFLEEKQIRPITAQHPLIFVVQESQFLHYTIQKCMQHLNIPHLITKLSSKQLQQKRKNMGHQVPTLIFADQVLETNQLVQFLCDAFLQDDEIIDFQSRKAYIKQLVLNWKEIFIFEKLYPHNFSKLKNLGVHDKRSYQNLILQQLQNLSVCFHGKILKRAYSKYAEDVPTLQNIIFVDIIQHIMQKTSESYIDYSLRCYYQNLIQMHSVMKNMIERAPVRASEQVHEAIILQFTKKKEQQNFETFRLNHKKFAFIFGLMATMYSIFAKS